MTEPTEAAHHQPQQPETTPAPPQAERAEQQEKQLLRSEMAGAQVLALFDGVRPSHGESFDTVVNTSVIESIAKGTPPKTENLSNSSRSEREEFWNGESSEYKDTSREERMQIWEEKLNAFLNHYKDKPEAEFLQRIGVSTENGAAGLYQKYIKESNGDVGVFVSAITKNNTAEQVEQHREFIQKLGKIYGANASKVTELLIEGIKNAETDTEGFIASAKEQFAKGENMPGIAILDEVARRNGQWVERQNELREQREQQEQEERARREEAEGQRLAAEAEAAAREAQSSAQSQQAAEPNPEEKPAASEQPTQLPQRGEQGSKTENKVILTNARNVDAEMQQALRNSAENSVHFEITPDILKALIEKELKKLCNIKTPLKASIIDSTDQSKPGKMLKIEGAVSKRWVVDVQFNVMLQNAGNELVYIPDQSIVKTSGNLAKRADSIITEKINNLNGVIQKQINDRLNGLGSVNGLQIGDGVIECKVTKSQRSAQAA